MGLIPYEMPTGNEAWHDVDAKEAQENLMERKMPAIDEKIRKSRDPVDLALREAIGMC